VWLHFLPVDPSRPANHPELMPGCTAFLPKNQLTGSPQLKTIAGCARQRLNSLVGFFGGYPPPVGQYWGLAVPELLKQTGLIKSRTVRPGFELRRRGLRKKFYADGCKKEWLNERLFGVLFEIESNSVGN